MFQAADRDYSVLGADAASSPPTMPKALASIPDVLIASRIHLVRHELVMADKVPAGKPDRMESRVGQHDVGSGALFEQVNLLGERKVQPRKRLCYRGGDDV